MTGATFIYHGGTIAGPFVLSGATLDLEASVASPDTFILEGSNTLASDVPAGHILQIIDGAGPSTLTSAAGFSNHGSIVFDTTIGYGNTLAITSGALTNAVDGSLTVNAGTGVPATISGQVVNHGNVTITAGATLSISGQVVNDGAFTIASGAAMSMTGGAATFDQAGGTLADSSAIPITGPTFIYHGGTITGAVVLSGATLDLEASVASPDTFILEGSNTLASDVPAGHILQIIDGAGPSTLTSAAGFSNHGSIVFDTTIGYGNTLAITSGALTNAADGSLTVNAGTGVPATISGQVVNHGNVTITAGATLSLGGSTPTFDQAGGTLTVNGSFPMTGATFIYHGGTIAGPFVLSGATLDLEASVASPDTFILEGSNTLASDVPAGHILQIIDGAGPSTLTSAAGFSNHGSIVFDTTIGYGNTLAITSGVLTNAVDGSLTVNAGTGVPATISGQVVNHGNVTITAGATLSMAGSYTQTATGALDLRCRRCVIGRPAYLDVGRRGLIRRRSAGHVRPRIRAHRRAGVHDRDLSVGDGHVLGASASGR